MELSKQLVTTKRATLPPLRKLFKPDPGNVLFDLDIVGAEGMYIAWEVGGKFKQDFLDGIPIHVETMKYIYPEAHAIKPKHEPQYTKCKNMLYGTTYVGSARGISSQAAIPLHLVEKFQPWIFRKYPGIKDWHGRVEESLSIKREVANHFGYRVHYFDRVEGLLPEAVNWLPQSSIGIVCQRAQLLIRRHFGKSGVVPLARQRMQVHDSILFQLPFSKVDAIKEIKFLLETDPWLLIPFPNDPLRLQWDYKASKKSWGDSEKFDFDKLGDIR